LKQPRFDGGNACAIFASELNDLEDSMKTVPWWAVWILPVLTSCGGANLQQMDATPFVQMVERPNGECPHSKIEQGLLNKHPGAAILVTYSEDTGTNVMTTIQVVVPANQTVYLGCRVLPSGQEANRKILNVQFE